MLTRDKFKHMESNIQSLTFENKLLLTVWKEGGLVPFQRLVEILLPPNIRYLRHYIRESYYLETVDGDIIKLCPRGTIDKREYFTPMLAPDVTSFTFSLLCKEFNLNHSGAIPFIQEYCNSQGMDTCKMITDRNVFYTVKKEVRKYLIAKGELNE